MAGVNALGRGQDRELRSIPNSYISDNGTRGSTTVYQSRGSNKRLAASQGIDVNLVKSMQEIQGKEQQAQQMAMQQQQGSNKLQ